MNFELVKIDHRYQTTVPIGNGYHFVSTIEFSEDGFLYGVNSQFDTLIRIDPSNGAAETVGPFGIDLNWAADLDEDGQGQLERSDLRPFGSTASRDPHSRTGWPHPVHHPSFHRGFLHNVCDEIKN